MADATVEQETGTERSTPEQFVKSSEAKANELIRIMFEIEEFCKKYSVDQSSLPSNESIIAFKKRMSNGMLLLPVIGRGSSGKSTLIDSILGDKFLPFSVGRDTTVRVFIRHDPTSCHAGQCNASGCSKCPKLYVGLHATKGNEVARGVGAIHDAILAYNEKLKAKNETSVSKPPDAQEPSGCKSDGGLSGSVDLQEPAKKQESVGPAEAPMCTPLELKETPKCLLLLANIPCIAASNTKLHLTPYLLDSEALEYLSDDTKDEMKVIVGTILVHKYTEFLQDKESIQMSLTLAKSDTVLVAVTNFDAFYEQGQCSSVGRNPTRDQTKQKFAKLSSVTEVENVFPICSKWALDGRIMKHSAEEDNKLKRPIQYALSLYKDEEIAPWMPGMSDDVIKASGIGKIEKRIQRLFTEVDHSTWCQIILDELTKFVEKSIKCAESIIFAKLNDAIKSESEKITTRENGKIALYKYKDFLQRKSEEQDREEYCERVRKVLAMPTDNSIRTLATCSVRNFLLTWEKKTDGTVFQFLSGMEELIRRRISAEIVECNAVDAAETELETTFNEFWEEYNKCCGYLEAFAADGRRMKLVEAMPGISSVKFKNEAKPLSPEAAQHLELMNSFRKAVEEKKLGILALIGTALSMASLVSIPWAIRTFRERHQQDQLGTSIARNVRESDSFIKIFTPENEEFLKSCKVSDYPGLERIKEKLNEMAISSEYIKALADGYKSATEVCVVEPFAEAARKGAKKVFKKLIAEIQAANMPQLEENFEKERSSVTRIVDDKLEIQQLITELNKLKGSAKRECPKKSSADGSM